MGGPIELKGHKPNASKAVHQLQAGADFAAELLENGRDVRFRPVLVHRGSMSVHAERIFRGKKVTFRGKKEAVRTCTRLRFPIK